MVGAAKVVGAAAMVVVGTPKVVGAARVVTRGSLWNPATEPVRYHFFLCPGKQIIRNNTYHSHQLALVVATSDLFGACPMLQYVQARLNGPHTVTV